MDSEDRLQLLSLQQGNTMSPAIEQLATKLGEALKQHEWKLATAESCTGGGLAYAVTDIPGSSAWFERGFVTYSNTAKQEALDVTLLTLSVFGAVSEQTAREMAEGALKNSQAQISIAITGIAGPDGGSVEKPIGTIWIALAGINKTTEAIVENFLGNRKQVREQTIEFALTKLLNFISNEHT